MNLDELKRRKVGVLMGGLSSERKVSLQTGQGVLAALIARGYQCVAINWTVDRDLVALLAEHQVEVVWNALHGTLGEDGAVQGFFTCLGIPFTGSGILASALAMDKVASKHIFDNQGIATPPWEVVTQKDVAARVSARGFPTVVKPSSEGSSVGVTIVRSVDEIEGAVAAIQGCKGEIIVESYIAGKEIQVGILDGEVLGSIEISPKSAFYDYAAKYERNDTDYLIPTTLEPEVDRTAQRLALAAHQALGCSSYSRVDLRVNGEGEAFVLEVNTLPGMTSHSLLPKIAAHVGIEYATLCERVLASAHVG